MIICWEIPGAQCLTARIARRMSWLSLQSADVKCANPTDRSQSQSIYQLLFVSRCLHHVTECQIAQNSPFQANKWMPSTFKRVTSSKASTRKGQPPARHRQGPPKASHGHSKRQRPLGRETEAWGQGDVVCFENSDEHD